MPAYQYRKPHSFRKKKSFLRTRSFWFGFLIFVVLMGVIYLLYFAKVFQIKEVIVEKEEITNSPGVAAVSEEIMGEVLNIAEEKTENKFFFLNTKSIFLFNSGSLSKEIAGEYPQLFSVEVRKKWPSEIKINLAKKVGLALLKIGQDYFLLDKEGIVFDMAKEIDINGLPVLTRPDYFLNSDDNVISEDDLSKILYLNDKLTLFNIPVKEYSLFSKDKLIIETKEGWDVYITLQSDLDWQLTKLNAVLEEKIPTEKRGDLEYVEVRFGNLAPFKYKD